MIRECSGALISKAKNVAAVLLEYSGRVLSRLNRDGKFPDGAAFSSSFQPGYLLSYGPLTSGAEGAPFLRLRLGGGGMATSP